MADQSDTPRLVRTLLTTRPTGEDHRVTTFELFFDLVYVFAVTQVTRFMADTQTARGVLQGLLILALLWSTWSGYTWLGNQTRADEGVLRAGMVVAMAAMFVVAMTIPEAWVDAPGGLNGPVVLVAAYLVVRCVQLAVYSMAATGDRALGHQVAISWVPLLAGAALLTTGVLLGGWLQTLLFAGAVLVDWSLIYLTSRRGGWAWRLHSPAHFVERHNLFMILAIGESVVAAGAGAVGQPISAPLILAAVLGIAAAVGLWWLYFDVVSLAAEHRLLEVAGQARVKMALDAYGYAHFPIVAGTVVAALGIEGVLVHASETEPLGLFYAAALFGGFALYLAGHLLFKHTMHNSLSVPRLLAVAALLALLPAAAFLPPVVGLAGLVVILAVLVRVETSRYAQVRDSLRSA